MVRNSELELGGPLIHPLKTFPNGTHVCSPCLVPQGLSLVINYCSQGLTADTRARRVSSFFTNHTSARSKVEMMQKTRSLFIPELDIYFNARPPYNHMFNRRFLCGYSLTRVLETDGLSFSRSHTILRPKSCVMHIRTHTRAQRCAEIC
jgi:hypothetical protein